MVRVRTGDADRRPARSLVLLLAVAGATVLVACTSGPSSGPSGTAGPLQSPAPSDAPSASGGPTPTTTATASPVDGSGAIPTPGPTTGPVPPSEACGNTEDHRAFFRQAAVAMSWPVYCAVLPEGWFLETGSYRLADGGRLEVTYRGPDDARLSLVEGNVCAGAGLDACAPRDAVIGSAAFGDRTGDLGRLANGLVLDVDRGATPSWRATGLGLSEEAFRAIGAALVRVET